MQARQLTVSRALVGALIGGIAGLVVVMIVAGIVSGLLIGPIRQDIVQERYGQSYRLALSLGASLGALVGWVCGFSYGRRAALLTLFQSNDATAVGAITDGLSHPEEELRSGVVSALTRLLPQCWAEGKESIPPRARQNLLDMITVRNAAKYPDYIVLLIGQLEREADPRAVPLVSALAEDRSTYHSGLKRAAAAARACLPVLLRNVEASRAAGSLLRPEKEIAPQSATLLRGVGQTPKQNGLLLRLVDSQSDEDAPEAAQAENNERDG